MFSMSMKAVIISKNGISIQLLCVSRILSIDGSVAFNMDVNVLDQFYKSID
jgi:hypothetical protein